MRTEWLPTSLRLSAGHSSLCDAIFLLIFIYLLIMTKICCSPQIVALVMCIMYQAGRLRAGVSHVHLPLLPAEH